MVDKCIDISYNVSIAISQPHIAYGCKAECNPLTVDIITLQMFNVNTFLQNTSYKVYLSGGTVTKRSGQNELWQYSNLLIQGGK